MNLRTGLSRAVLGIILSNCGILKAQTTFTHDAAGNRSGQVTSGVSAPTIVLQPADQSVQTGGTATLGVIAGGPGPFTYQWYKDGTPINGATSDILVVANVQSGDFTSGPGGSPAYSVRVTNLHGTTASIARAIYRDSSGRGLPDWWRSFHFNTTDPVDPSADPDGDGLTNLQEYLDTSSPVDGGMHLARLFLEGPGAQVLASPARTSYQADTYATATATSLGESQFGGWTGTHRSLSSSLTFQFKGQASVANVHLVGLFGAFPPEETGASPSFTKANGDPAKVTGFATGIDGSTIVIGDFDRVNGQPRPYVARLLPDRTLDPNFSPSPDGPVKCAVVQHDGKIILGGAFNSAGGQTRRGLARFQTNGSLDAGFPEASLLTNASQVGAIALQNDRKILISGSINTGSSTAALMRLTTAGTIDSTFSASPNAPPSSILVQPDGGIIVAGAFTQMGATPANQIARLLTDGSLDSTFSAELHTSPPSVLKSLVLQPDGKLLVAGFVHTLVGQYPVARFNTDGTADVPFHQNLTALPVGLTFSSLALQNDGRIIAGGSFTIPSPSLVNLIRLKPDGGIDGGNFTITRPDAAVDAIAIHTDGNLMIGGAFTNVPPGTGSGNAHTYHLTSGKKSVLAAQAEARAVGGHLVSINDAAEQKFLADLLPALGLRRRPVWMGLTDIGIEGLWKWDSGEPVSYLNWQPGEPSGGTTENHTALNWMSSYNNGAPDRWVDIFPNGTTYGGLEDGPYYGLIEIDPQALPNTSVNWIAGRDLARNEKPDGTAGELANPNARSPVWSYGYRTTLASPSLTLFAPAHHVNLVGGNEHFEGWVNGSVAAVVNVGPEVTNPGFVSPEEMRLHPGSDLSYSIVRWTAPQTGTYLVSAFWQDADRSGGDGASGHLLVNGVLVFDSTFEDGNGTFTNQMLNLTTGDRIEFATGARASSTGDSTRFNAIIKKTITQTPDSWVAGRDLITNEKPDGAPKALVNPNPSVPAWSYGYRTGDLISSDFTLFSGAAQHSDQFSNGGAGDTIEGWRVPGGVGIGVNTGTSPVAYNYGFGPNVPFNPGELQIFPASHNGPYPVLRWTAPADGSYDVLAFWHDSDFHGGNGFNSIITVNGSQVYGQDIDNGAGGSHAGTLTLKQNDKVDFLIGTRGEFSFDVTKFNVAILGGSATPVAPPPVAVDDLARPRAKFARLVTTNNLVPGTLVTTGGGSVFPSNTPVALTFAPASSGTPITFTKLEHSPDGVWFADSGYGPNNGGATWTLPVAALPPGHSYYRAMVRNANREEAHTFALGPYITPPAILGVLSRDAMLGVPFSHSVTATGPLLSFAASALPPWATWSYDSAGGRLTISGTPSTTGASSIGLHATNEAGTGNAVFDLVVARTFEDWQTANFTAAEIWDYDVSGELADYTGGGTVNLIKFALGMPPKSGNAAGLPVPSVQQIGAGKYLTLTYTRDRFAGGLAFEVEVSGQLQGWNSGSGHTVEISRTISGSTETVVTRDLTPISNANRRFMRLKVSK